MGVEAHYDLERAPDTSVFSPAVGKGSPAMQLFIFVCLVPLSLLSSRVVTSVCIGPVSMFGS